MNREQTKLLKLRLNKLNNTKTYLCCKTAQAPKHVRAASRIVKRWEAEQQRIRNRRQDRLQVAYGKALNAVLFENDPKVVLRALAVFESFKP